ncbi:MAG: cysteine--tRNA ligase [Ammonifex sp.]|nr:MAG: cysteine--tRNA ligase [Ammonifex sp.]
MEVYNTLSRRKEQLIPAEPGRVRMYVCGPTTYNYIHLGNARTFVLFDTIRRYLEYCGFKVILVQNFTDVDDKIIKRAAEEGTAPHALALKYTEAYYEDADRLNILRADVHPRVSEHIEEIISLIESLVAKGFAYAAGGDAYFSVRRYPDYGKLSGRSPDEMLAGARVEPGENKRDPLDFALWKAAKPGEPKWPSPWGEGRPGWHIECSAMALKYLGADFDIHGGGADLVFPHHENEIAQSEAATGKPFARYWLHNGFITVRQEKMSKSIGNVFLVREVLERYPAPAVRLFLLGTHYRSPLDYAPEYLEAAVRGVERLKNCFGLLTEAIARATPGGDAGDILADSLSGLDAEFRAAMDDDFNSARALACYFDLVREVNTVLHAVPLPSRKVLEQAMDLFSAFNHVLGIFPEKEGKPSFEKTAGDDDFAARLLDLIIAVRQEARLRKDWAVADQIREGLKEIGVVLEDTPEGVRWKKV